MARWLQGNLPKNWMTDKAWMRVTLPRGHLKTSICTKMFPIWLYIHIMALRECGDKTVPELRAMISSNTDANSGKMVGMIRGFIQNNPKFKALWPDRMPKSLYIGWSNERAVMPCEGVFMEGTFNSAGIGKDITGLHFPVFIEDDTISPKRDELTGEEYIPTREEMEKAIGWHKLVGPFMEPPWLGVRLVVGTRWAKGDLIEHVQSRPGWKHFELACVKDTPEGSTLEESWKQGTPISHRHPMKVLEIAREELGRYFFNALYLNKPVSSENQVFSEPFNYFTDGDIPSDATIVMTVDPAVSQKESADFTAIICAAHSPGKIQVLLAEHGRWKPSEVVNRVLLYCNKFNANHLILEAISGFQTFIYAFRDEILIRDMSWIWFDPVTSLKNTKNQRIMGLQPLFESGVIELKKNQSALMSELLEFTPDGARLRHDDLIDALSLHLKVYKRQRRAPEAPKEKWDGTSKTWGWDDFHPKPEVRRFGRGRSLVV